MYEPLKFKRMKEIAADLNDKLDQLEVGTMSKEHLEALTEQSRELYERLVVLRFKAYDKEIKNETKAEETPVKETPAIPFSIGETKTETSLPGQVSLIDLIEEETKSTINATPDLSSPEVSTPEIVAETTATTEKDEIPVAHIPVATPAPQFNTPVSLYDRLTKNIAVAETIAEKSEHLPIADLKKAISLNQRFQFSKELFKGNNQDYEVSIDKLNASGRDEAMKLVETLRGKYSWPEGSAVAADFVDLVNRRHQ